MGWIMNKILKPLVILAKIRCKIYESLDSGIAYTRFEKWAGEVKKYIYKKST